MLEDGTIRMAQAVDAAGSPLDVACLLRLDQANRHGLIAGASGTGKTVTLKVMAEGFSQAGVPVFMADVKGDVTDLAQAARAAALGAPACHWRRRRPGPCR